MGCTPYNTESAFQMLLEPGWGIGHHLLTDK